MIAAWNGKAEVVKLLIAAGADTTATTNNTTETAFYYAALSGNKATIQALIDEDGINNAPKAAVTALKSLNNQFYELQFITSNSNVTNIEIEVYEYDYVTETGESVTHTIAGASRNFLIHGLSDDKYYSFRIRAKNNYGWGEYTSVTVDQLESNQ